MIYLMLGRPGGGKSYEATVYHVLPALMAGRKVITNLPLNVERFRALVPNLEGLLVIRAKSASGDSEVRVFASPDDYGDEWRHPDNGSGPLYVIDECHKSIPKVGTSRAVEEWFAEHRHETADVLLISQSYGKLNKAIVDMVDVCYAVQKATALGASGKYVRKVSFGVRGEVVNTSIRTYEAKYFGLYQSHTRGGGAELMARDIRPIWYHWTFVGAGIIGVFCVVWVSYFGFDLFGDAERVAAKASPPPGGFRVVSSADAAPTSDAVAVRGAVPAAGSAAPPVAVPSVATDGPFVGMGIHVAGYVASARRKLYLLGLSQNGVVVRMTDSDELVRVGYTVEPVGECVARVGYGDRSEWVRCDMPSATVSPFAGVGTRGQPTAGTAAAGGSPALAGEAPLPKVPPGRQPGAG